MDKGSVSSRPRKEVLEPESIFVGASIVSQCIPIITLGFTLLGCPTFTLTP